jgi:hypothetical protein
VPGRGSKGLERNIAVPQIDISPAKVAFLIVKAREFQANFAPLDEGDQETSGKQRLVENRPSILLCKNFRESSVV